MAKKLGSEDTDKKLSTQEKNMVAACGLYCGACGIYQATQEDDSERILQYAVVLNQAVEATKCDGCGAQRKSMHCKQNCYFTKCNAIRGIGSCGICFEFPCADIVRFQSQKPRCKEIVTSLFRKRDVGLEQWLSEMIGLFTCKECHTINSAYDLICRKCGVTPGNEFIRLNRVLIEKYFSE